jgi:23S rRNA (pseudouridine1915-N3)-methyltransferase
LNWTIIAIGKPKLAFARAGVAEYARRLQTRVDIIYLPASDATSEGQALLRRSEGTLRIALDERGEELTSRELTARISGWERDGVKSAALLIGGAGGHNESVRTAAGWTWSLSRLTLQHELALVVALEQLYRAYSIKAGTPYHRD